jgi:D-tyrosyl-tRNA(Tyr) deacylase
VNGIECNVRAVLQRVREGKVTVDGRTVGEIGRGLVVLVGIGREDTFRDIAWMVEKIVNLRIFEAGETHEATTSVAGKLDKSVLDIDGSLLLVSQFTLYGDCRKGRRPSFSDAMAPGEARRVFELLVAKIRERVRSVETGVFQASMDVSLVNEGPVTIILDSRYMS